MIELLANDGDGVFSTSCGPACSPGGFTHPSAEAVPLDREYHLTCVRRMLLRGGGVRVTLGLTEAWGRTAPTGTVFPACPGTAAGTFDPERHRPGRELRLPRRCWRTWSGRSMPWDATTPPSSGIFTVSPVPLGGDPLLPTK